MVRYVCWWAGLHLGSNRKEMNTILKLIFLLLISFNVFASELCGSIVFKDYQAGGYMGRETIYSVWLSSENDKPRKFDVNRDLYKSVIIGDHKCIIVERPSLIQAIFVAMIILIFVLMVWALLNLII